MMYNHTVKRYKAAKKNEAALACCVERDPNYLNWKQQNADMPLLCEKSWKNMCVFLLTPRVALETGTKWQQCLWCALLSDVNQWARLKRGAFVGFLWSKEFKTKGDIGIKFVSIYSEIWGITRCGFVEGGPDQPGTLLLVKNENSCWTHFLILSLVEWTWSLISWVLTACCIQTYCFPQE